MEEYATRDRIRNSKTKASSSFRGLFLEIMEDVDRKLANEFYRLPFTCSHRLRAKLTEINRIKQNSISYENSFRKKKKSKIKENYLKIHKNRNSLKLKKKFAINTGKSKNWNARLFFRIS